MEEKKENVTGSFAAKVIFRNGHLSGYFAARKSFELEQQATRPIYYKYADTLMQSS